MALVGDELAKILHTVGIYETVTCGCKGFRRKMNRRGITWCENHVPEILAHMKQQAQKRKIWYLFNETVARGMIDMAIKRARKSKDRPLADFFERVYCINLRRRPDRKKRVQSELRKHGWPFQDIEWIDAVDGKNVPVAPWWKAGGGAWGCYRSHLRLIEECLNDGVESVLLLEDDMTIDKDFVKQVTEFCKQVPEDWGMLYLGGQHLYVNQQAPTVVKGTNGLVYRPYNVNRTHAWALRGDTMRKAYKHLNRKDWQGNMHIDHHLGRMHQRREDPIYCPNEWLIGQADGKSNISGREIDRRFWTPAETYEHHKPDNVPFVAVVGLHSSGSSCLAGVLYHLGVYLGDKLVGYYGNDPDKNCGFEAVGLRDICEGAIPFPAREYKWPRHKIWNKLRGWINTNRRHASEKGTIAGGKYPMLCRMGNQLMNICGSSLRVIHITRPTDESIESLVRRAKQYDSTAVAEHQQWLEKGKEQFLKDVKKDQLLEVAYADLLANPKKEVERIAEFLELKPDVHATARACSYVKPEMRNVVIEEDEYKEV